MGVRFEIVDWAALAPGLVARADWQSWADAPWLPQGPLEAKLESMPAMQRRRLNELGRAAAQVAWDFHSPRPETPVVFASGYGDAHRALNLLKEFASTGHPSPTDFALSVHNAIGAMYSIARSDGAAYSSVAAGAASAAAGVLECCSLLAEGAHDALLVCYDSPLPGEYATFHREPMCAYAWAWRITAARDDRPHIALDWSDSENGDEQQLPFGLQSLRIAVGSVPTLSAVAEGTCWTWSRHD